VFCDGTDISQEHLVADWALRGAAKSRRPKLGTTHWVAPTLAVTTDEEPISKAGVTWNACNGGSIKEIDDAVAAIMKPMIRGERSVVLTRHEQIGVAAWVVQDRAGVRSRSTTRWPIPAEVPAQGLSPTTSWLGR
jgi:hypothetical protein